MVSQFIGAVVGTMLLRLMIPSSQQQDYAMTRLSKHVTVLVGIVYEMLFSLLYTLLYFSFTSRGSKNTFRESHAPLAIGLFYGVSHIVIVDKTGCSLNPARSLGPAFVTNNFDCVWVYVAGPLLASCFGVLMHDLVLRKARNRLYPRPRSVSLVCCNPSREEIVLREPHGEYQPQYVIENTV